MDKFTVTYTDTFSGEANYCWLRQANFTLKVYNKRSVIRKAKALMGLTNVRGVTEDWGDCLRFKPYRSNTVMFVKDNDNA